MPPENQNQKPDRINLISQTPPPPTPAPGSVNPPVSTPPIPPPQTPAPTPTPEISQASGSREYFEPIQTGQYPFTNGPLAPANTAPEVSKTAKSREEIRTNLQAEVRAFLPNEQKTQTDAIIKPHIQTVGPTTQIESLRTYKSDIAQAVRHEQSSVIKIAVAEEKRRTSRGENANVYVDSKKNTLMILGSIFLVLAGIGVGYGAYKIVRRPQTFAPIVLPGKPLVATDYQKEIPVDLKTSAEVLGAINTEQAGTQTLGTIESLYFTEKGATETKTIPFDKFVSLTSTEVPSVLLRSLSDEFMFGIHYIKGGKKFLILKPRYYEGAFSAALNWEPTMGENLSSLFPGASMTKAAFIDKVIQNKDTRVLYDTDNNAVLVYSFVDKDHIIITEDEETLVQIFNRVSQAVKAIQ